MAGAHVPGDPNKPEASQPAASAPAEGRGRWRVVDWLLIMVIIAVALYMLLPRW